MANVAAGGTGPTSDGGTAKLPPSTPASAQVNATIQSTHEMMVSLGIMTGIGLILIVIAGQSKSAGNTVAVLLAVLLLEQGIFHVNPLAAFLAGHPLIPKPTQ